MICKWVDDSTSDLGGYCVDSSEKTVFATYIIRFNDFAVNIIYNETENNPVIKGTWHPNQKRNFVRVRKET